MAGPAPDSHHELYKNARRASLSSPKGTSSLDILLQMGFSRLRAEKAIVATGDRGGNLAADWLLSHINDPNLDFDMPREFVLYLCPTGDLATDLDHYWKNTLAQCGWNGAHNFLPHITLCPFFKAKDSQVPHILRAVEKQREKRYPTRVDLNHFTAPNFIGLFVGEKCAAVLRNLVAEFAEDVHKSGVQMEAHQKQLHVTLAYQYSPEQHALLEKLSKSIKLDTPTRWDLRLYSRDARAHGTEVRRVLYAYQARQDDELDLILGDFIYMSPLDTGDPEWRQGVSWLTGCSGKFPLNHTSRSPESKTWTLHKSVEVISKQQPTSASGEHHVVAEGSKDVLYAKVQKHPPPRVLIVVRHGERMDQNFGYSWMDGCYNGGVYVRKDLNMPKTIPVRKGGPMDYQKDCPLTVIGTVQAKMTGEALKEQGVTFSHVYASPSFRCVQTAHYLLKGLGQDCVIRVEDGLFEWCGWYKPGMPVWFTPAELRQNGYNVDSQYSPHYPAKKLTPDESIDDYYQRCYHVTKTMLKSHEKEGNVLIVAHAASLDVCTRQLVGGQSRESGPFHTIVRQVPYLGLCACQTNKDGKWEIVPPPTPTLAHGGTHSFNWRCLLGQ